MGFSFRDSAVRFYSTFGTLWFLVIASLAACGGAETSVSSPVSEGIQDSAAEPAQSARNDNANDPRPRLGHGCVAANIDALVGDVELSGRLRCACGDSAACESAGDYVCHFFGQSSAEGCDASGVLANNDLPAVECLPDSHLRGPEETYRQCVCGVEAACLALEETVQLHRFLGLDPGMPEIDWFDAHEEGVLAIFE